MAYVRNKIGDFIGALKNKGGVRLLYDKINQQLDYNVNTTENSEFPLMKVLEIERITECG